MLRTTLFLSLLLLSVAFVHAQHHDSGAAKSNASVDLGSIDFPNSGPAEAQKSFIEGVLLLHSFEYDRARRAFSEASRLAPNFALAYWGEAMTYDHPIWPENDKSGGLAALAKLGATPDERRKKAPTEREKIYLDAVERLFGEGDSAARAAAYSQAMADLTRKYPDDLEARAFYALSILGLTRTTRNTENYMRAAAVAETVYEKNPKHPGALHYLIHAYDDPVHAPLGLRAASVYGSVAKGASHAQHMPSHIFFALGMWEESIDANTASMKTARDAGQGGYHPLHWLEHSYLQLGRFDDASKTLAIIENDAKGNSSSYNRTHLAMCRATMLVETRGSGPASIMEQVDASGISTQGYFVGHDLAIGLEYVRRNEIAAARRSLDSIRTRAASMKNVRSSEPATENRYAGVTQTEIDTVNVMESMLAAAIEFASGDKEKGLRMMVAAAENEDKLIFEYGPPAIVKPAWEAAGEMLLAAGRRTEAANAFRNVLKRYPNRRLSKEGLKAATVSSQTAAGR